MITTAEIHLMIELAARALVNKPNSVRVEQIEAQDGLTFHIRCADGDLGRLIGLNGMTARSLRHVVTCAGKASGTRYFLTIEDGRSVRNNEPFLHGVYEFQPNSA